MESQYELRRELRQLNVQIRGLGLEIQSIQRVMHRLNITIAQKKSKIFSSGLPEEVKEHQWLIERDELLCKKRRSLDALAWRITEKIKLNSKRDELVNKLKELKQRDRELIALADNSTNSSNSIER